MNKNTDWYVRYYGMQEIMMVCTEYPTITDQREHFMAINTNVAKIKKNGILKV